MDVEEVETNGAGTDDEEGNAEEADDEDAEEVGADKAVVSSLSSSASTFSLMNRFSNVKGMT